MDRRLGSIVVITIHPFVMAALVAATHDHRRRKRPWVAGTFDAAMTNKNAIQRERRSA
jgi:hypothetical protein